jgi:hypothetical protein
VILIQDLRISIDKEMAEAVMQNLQSSGKSVSKSEKLTTATMVTD